MHPDAHADLVAAMEKLTDPSTARSMGASAAVRAADSSWNHVASRLLEALGDARARDLGVRAS